jgi:hypothetical protein
MFSEPRDIMQNILYLVLLISVSSQPFFLSKKTSISLNKNAFVNKAHQTSCNFFCEDLFFNQRFFLFKKIFSTEERIKSSFRYVVYSNQVVDRHKRSANRRYVFVLMEKSAFSPANLRRLFDKLSLKYSTPVNMEIYVYTDLQQTTTPEEAEDRSPGISESARENPVVRFPYAIYFRSKSGAYFQYTDTPPQVEFKKVTIN